MSKILKCKYCGKEFEPGNFGKGIHMFCCRKCRDKYNELQIPKICLQCGKEFYSESHTKFCSEECKNKHKENLKIEKECLNCGKHFFGYPWQKFCSNKCKQFYGYHNNNLIETICDFCGNKFVANKQRLSNNGKLINKDGDQLHFCSHSCIIGYLYNENIITALFSKPHKIVNSLLEELNIEFENEYHIKNYSLDIKLKNYNKAIEVMGTYWHGDSRNYNKSELEIRQQNCIDKDKKKLETINKYNISILYLWQIDIEKYPDKCVELIKDFVFNDKNNIHSSNFDLINNKLVLNNIKQYMQLSTMND